MILNSRLKIILLALALAIGTILIGWLLYALLLKPAPPAVEVQTEQTTDSQTGGGTLTLSEEAGERAGTEEPTGTGTLPSAVASGGATFTQRLTSTGIDAPTLLDGNAIAYYNPIDGRFYMIDDSGNIKVLSNAQFPGAASVVFADSAEIVALEFPDGSNILYNLEQEKQITLPSHWEEFEFSGDGSQVINKVITASGSNNALTISQSDGSKTTAIADLGGNADKVTVNWSPNNQVVGFSQTGSTQSGFGRSQIYLIGVDGQEAGAIIVEGANFSGIWSPSGNTILYSVALASNDDRPSLWLTNATGEVGHDRTRLEVETWVEKCTFTGEESIICAAPKEVTAGSGIDDRLITSSDNIYEINLISGRAKLLATPVLDLKLFNLKVSDDGTLLYFTDQYERLNYMKLK